LREIRVIDRNELQSRFSALYGGTPRLFFAPGRVNLIGEHTDYNDGFVLPLSLTQGTLVAARRRDDRLARAFSDNLEETGGFDLDRPGPPRRGSWLDYVEGTAQALEAAGFRLAGADLAFLTNLPLGAGLSSSAALEISTGLAFLHLSGHPVDRRTLAFAGRDAEWEWAGVQCGIMDQFASVFGQAGHALLIDCRSLEVSPVPLDLSRVALVLSDSREEHALASSEYNARRAECRQAVDIIQADHPEWSIGSLRDVTPAMLEGYPGGRLTGVPWKRARHVVTENARTLAAADLLARGDWAGVGRLMAASHRSLRDDYEVSTPRLDFLVDTALELPGVLGSRMTGGGFGGCTITAVEREHLADFEAAVARAWPMHDALPPAFYQAVPGDGASEWTAGS
jgi:galactokinase